MPNTPKNPLEGFMTEPPILPVRHRKTLHPLQGRDERLGSPSQVSGLCPDCNRKAETYLEALMRGELTLARVPSVLSGWLYAGDHYAWTVIRAEVEDLYRISDHLLREREKAQLKTLLDWPSFPALCEIRGEPWRAVAHTRELESVMARLENLWGGRS